MQTQKCTRGSACGRIFLNPADFPAVGFSLNLLDLRSPCPPTPAPAPLTAAAPAHAPLAVAAPAYARLAPAPAPLACCSPCRRGGGNRVKPRGTFRPAPPIGAASVAPGPPMAPILRFLGLGRELRRERVRNEGDGDNLGRARLLMLGVFWSSFFILTE